MNPTDPNNQNPMSVSPVATPVAEPANVAFNATATVSNAAPVSPEPVAQVENITAAVDPVMSTPVDSTMPVQTPVSPVVPAESIPEMPESNAQASDMIAPTETVIPENTDNSGGMPPAVPPAV